uniref:Vesicle transport protein n=1 Tax=Peronospora matthiolae TaxID=2874970 RepID=A0AAV1TDL0_9STRA
MDQMKIVISEAGDKVAGAASDASKKLTSLTGDKKTAFWPETAPSQLSADSIYQSTCPSLTKKQRLTGFVSCFVLGYLVNFGSTFALVLSSNNGAKFGVTYTLGNIISLCGSGFLVGPTQQVKLMLKPIRRIATIIYLAMIAVVVIVAVAAPQLGLVVLLLVFIQCLAALWYSTSYIPYGRKVLTGIANKLCGAAA